MDAELYRDMLDWIAGADHQSGCPGQWPEYRCKCGLRELQARIFAVARPTEREPDEPAKNPHRLDPKE